MKKLFLVASFILTFFYSFSQVDSMKFVYCELVGTPFMGKMSVVIDMGENRGFLGLSRSFIMDEQTGKQKKFNTMIDAMNFMAENTWELIQAYTAPIGSSISYHYVLKQIVTKDSKGNYYPVTKGTLKTKE